METFRLFKDKPAAEDLAIWFGDRGLAAEVADTSVSFDPSFANSILSKEWAVRLHPEDFSKASDLLHHYYDLRLDEIPKDYYLFSFSEEELQEILTKPDEWGDLDYVLAQKILETKGKAVSSEELTKRKEVRYQELSQPEEHDAGGYIGWGYGLSLVGGILGSLLGWHLMKSEKVLPDGAKVPRYTPGARTHGKRIFWLGLFFTALFILLKMYAAYQTGDAGIYHFY